MQYPFSCTPPVLHAIETTLSAPRLSRYLPAAGGDRHLALRLYMWNARLCEAFYLPMQLAEVAARNAIHSTLTARYSSNWHANCKCVSNLPARLQDELARVVSEERTAKGGGFTVDHVVSSLSFGFWLNTTTRRYDHLLWKRGMHHAFPCAPSGTTRQTVHDKLNRMRLLRNRIAHHGAIFDKKPAAEFQNVLEILSWTCPETHWLATIISNVSRVINARPR